MSVVCPQLDLIQTVSLPDDPPWTIQKPHIDLCLTHQKKHLGDDCLFQSLFVQLKSCYPDHGAIYTDGSKVEKVAAASKNQVRLPGNGIYLFGVLRRFQHYTGHITTGICKGRGNQYI